MYKPNPDDVRIEATRLVAAAQSGDRRSFDALVRRFRPRIFALTLHLTGCRSDAEDITQDTFMKAYSRIREFEGRSEFFTWLYRIALHASLNHRRRKRTVELDDPRVGVAVTVDGDGMDPRQALELREEYSNLIMAFDSLSESLRVTVALTTLQGMSYQETAVVLGTTVGTVAWRVHEAREQLRKEMARLERSPQSIAEQGGRSLEGVLLALAGL